MEKYGRARQATDNNIIRRMRFLYWITKAADTLRMCNNCWFSTATMVARTRLNITCIRTLPVWFKYAYVTISAGRHSDLLLAGQSGVRIRSRARDFALVENIQIGSG